MSLRVVWMVVIVFSIVWLIRKWRGVGKCFQLGTCLINSSAIFLDICRIRCCGEHWRDELAERKEEIGGLFGYFVVADLGDFVKRIILAMGGWEKDGTIGIANCIHVDGRVSRYNPNWRYLLKIKLRKKNPANNFAKKPNLSHSHSCLSFLFNDICASGGYKPPRYSPCELSMTQLSNIYCVKITIQTSKKMLIFCLQKNIKLNNENQQTR